MANRSIQDKHNLTDKQWMFCKQYIACDFNGTEAGIKAGYSPKTAPQQANRLLKNVKVKKALEEMIGKKVKKLDITIDKVLEEYAKIAFANILDFLEEVPVLNPESGDPEIDDTGRVKMRLVMKPLDKLDGTLIQSIKPGEIKLWSKEKALDKLGQYLKLWDDEDSKGNVEVFFNIPRPKKTEEK